LTKHISSHHPHSFNLSYIVILVALNILHGNRQKGGAMLSGVAEEAKDARYPPFGSLIGKFNALYIGYLFYYTLFLVYKGKCFY